MTEEIDARNLGCPQPVVLAKKALEEIASGVVLVRVNSEVSKENVVRYATSQHYPVEVTAEGGEYAIRITKEGEETEAEPQEKPATGLPAQGLVLFVTSESLGRGSDELGLTLMRNFILTLLNNSESPVAMLFVNSGVKLCCEGSPALEYLMTLHTQEHVPRWLIKNEQAALVRAVRESGSARDEAMVGLMLHAGLRVGELCSLMREHIHIFPQMGKVCVTRMGTKYREVPLNSTVRKILKHWLEENPSGPIGVVPTTNLL
ncbi:MAG: sulfurtransferase-like selenium metabolism protein YedF [Bacillota bacterium]